MRIEAGTARKILTEGAVGPSQRSIRIRTNMERSWSARIVARMATKRETDITEKG